jgi:hypothetical protein
VITPPGGDGHGFVKEDRIAAANPAPGPPGADLSLKEKNMREKEKLLTVDDFMVI